MSQNVTQLNRTIVSHILSILLEKTYQSCLPDWHKTGEESLDYYFGSLAGEGSTLGASGGRDAVHCHLHVHIYPGSLRHVQPLKAGFTCI
jgi:hypothetical protein